ncbi:MAG TPA: hypothetical protein DEP28_03580 [Bacteroidetes bacterium]|nr:hypothetical protein [Bacteroidota bacterium]
MRNKLFLMFGLILFIGITLNNLQAFSNQNNDCCKTGAACCEVKSDCCDKSEKTGTVQGVTNETQSLNNDCCKSGAACCEVKSACCDNSEKTGTVQGVTNESQSMNNDCCSNGAACCDDKSACCDKSNKSGTSQGSESDSAICLVSKEKFPSGSGEKFTYLGTEYEFCCGGCVNEFKSASIKYTDGKAMCPTCMHDDAIESLNTVHDKTTYYFCNENCKTKFEKNPEKYKDGNKGDNSHKH